MPARSSAGCASLPVTPREYRSIRKRWLSVPPVTMRKPALEISAANLRALATICFAYSLNPRIGRFLQAHGLGGDDVHQRPALRCRET